MGETDIHRTPVDYLKLVIEWLFHEQLCTVYADLNFYQTAYYREHPLGPDVAVIKGVNALYFRGVTSWRVGVTGPAPQVVFEIASKKTWETDLVEKPFKYAQMGVAEYYAYDPNVPPLPLSEGQRLRGWQLDHGVREMPLDADGRLWSEHLDSFLVPEGMYLRLYDRNKQKRLTQAEAEAEARKAEARRADEEANRADAEARRADEEAEARKAETIRADAEAKRAEVMAEKLRAAGIDPDQI